MGINTRVVYPLDITRIHPLLKAAQKKTGIKSQAEVLRMAIERGLPVLIAQLGSHQAPKAAARKVA